MPFWCFLPFFPGGIFSCNFRKFKELSSVLASSWFLPAQAGMGNSWGMRHMGPSVVHQNNRKLVVFDRKLEGKHNFVENDDSLILE